MPLEAIIAITVVLILTAIYFIATTAVIIKLCYPKKRTNDFLIHYETTEKKLDPALLSLPYEKFSIKSSGGYTLFGRLYKPESVSYKLILLLHGHNSSGIGQLKYLRLFLSLGYNVFIPDHRRSGESGGKSITFGAHEKTDVISWIDLLEKRFPECEFAVFGESMGAATAIMVTALDKRIKFLIEYCGYAGFKYLALPKLKSRALYYFLKPGLSVCGYLIAGMRLKEINVLEAMRSITVPVLIMHSKGDRLVYVSNAYALKKANPNAKTVYFEDAPHARSIVYYKEEYENAIRDFVKSVEKR